MKNATFLSQRSSTLENSVIRDSQDDDVAYSAMDAIQVEILLSALTPRDADILKMRFGIFPYAQMTLKQCAAKHGITRERCRQIERSSIYKIRREFNIAARNVPRRNRKAK